MVGFQNPVTIDIHEEMVELAKQATSQFSMVNIHVGDVMHGYAIW